MRDYQTQVIAYTSGKGRMFCSLKGYFPCHDAEEVIREAGYDPEGDMENPTGSGICSHGAGFVVNWDQVEDYMHLESCFPAKGRADTGKTGTAENFGRLESGDGSLLEE